MLKNSETKIHKKNFKKGNGPGLCIKVMHTPFLLKFYYKVLITQITDEPKSTHGSAIRK
jgi:hypothetical protein